MEGRIPVRVSTAFLFSMIFVTALSICVTAYLWISSVQERFRQESGQLRLSYIESSKAMLKDEVRNAVNYVEFMKSQTEVRLREEIRQRTYEACDIASNIYQENRGLRDDGEIRKMVRDALRPIRFNAGRGYYFATDLNGIEQLFADRPELEGKDLSEMRDTRGKFVIRDMIEIAETEGEGFYEYRWTKPLEAGRDYPKIAFGKRFDPFGWFIGTGEYLDDVEKDIRREVLERIGKIRFGKDGYVFVGRNDGHILLGPEKGKNLYDFKDINGVNVIQELIGAAEAGGGFVSYVMPEVEGHRSARKLSYAEGIKEWGWYVGAGVYVDEIDRVIAEKEDELKSDVKRQVGMIILITLALLAVNTLLAKFISTRVKRSFAVFHSFLDKAETGSESIDVRQVSFSEFAQLALSANKMLKDRRKAEEGLKESEEKYRRLVERANDGIVIVQERVLKYVNPSLAQIVGYREEELREQPFARFIHPEEQEKVSERYRRRMAGEEVPRIYETAFLSKDGRRIEIELNAGVIQYQGKPADLVFVRDVTERKAAERALRESESNYRLLVENMTELIVEFDLSWRLLFVSPTYCEVFGRKEEELLGGSFLPLIHEEDRPLALHSLQRVMAPPHTTYHEERTYTKGGLRWFAWSAKGVPNASGHVEAVIAVGRDITEKKEAEERVRLSEKRFRDLFDSITDLVYTQDLEGRFLSVNPALTKTFGYEPEEILGRRAVEFMKPEMKDPFETEYLGQIQSQGYHQGTSSYFAKDGRKIYLEYRSILVKPEEGEPYISGTGREVTDRILAGKQIKQLQERVLQSEKMEAIGTLAGGIAHDFNNLLMGIQGNASLMLLDMEPAHPHHERLKNIEEYVKSGADLTRQLLGFARGGKYEVKPSNLNEIVERSSRMFGRTRKEMRIHTKFDDRLWTVEVDRAQFEQVLLNLLVNAWQSMPSGGDLYLETANVVIEEETLKPQSLSPGKYVQIAVTDSGVGMDKATQQRIFEPFFTTKEMGRGTGLGLAVVYGIIANHGGFIDVYSEKGYGTTFRLYLPASEKRAEKESEPSQQILKGSGTVLLVDDEEVIMDVCTELLEGLGYRALTARSGQEAVGIYRDKADRIDVIILDMIMPGMGGGEAFDLLREINPKAKILLSSGYNIEGQATEILAKGCNGFIQKPFNMRHLSLKLSEVLKG